MAPILTLRWSSCVGETGVPRGNPPVWLGDQWPSHMPTPGIQPWSQRWEASVLTLRQPDSPQQIVTSRLLYENIDQILPNKLHRPMHYKIGVTCVYNLDTCSILCCNNLMLSYPPISQFNNPCKDFTSVYIIDLQKVSVCLYGNWCLGKW